MTTGVHHISERDFHLLAAGRGDARTIAALRDGQLSKHMILLRAVDDMAAAVAPTQHAAANVAASYALLAEVERVAADVARQMLLHPHVGGWLCHCLNRLHEPGPWNYELRLDLAHCANIAAAAAIRAGLSFRIPVLVRGGRVALPTLGAAIVHGTDAAVHGDQDGATVTADGIRVKVPVNGARSSGWLPVRRLRAGADGLRIQVDLEDLDPYRAHNYPEVSARLSEEDALGWGRLLDDAWTLLVEDHPAYAEAIAAGLRSLVPQQCGTPGRSVSATSTDAFGSVALSRPTDVPSLASTLIHEFQHAKLSALMDILPLSTTSGTARYYAPWRDDPRPLAGLLQGTYAFLGVTDFWRVYRRRGRQADHNALPDFEFARWLSQTTRACDELSASGELTEAGRQFVCGMRTTLDGWRHELVPAAVAAQAEDTAIDHWAHWRIRNLRPDSQVLDELAAAWVNGATRTALPRHSELVTGGVPTHSDTARLRLWHLRMTDPARFTDLTARPDELAAELPGATLADMSYVQGDAAEAEAGYRKRIAAGFDPPAWVGLALACRATGDVATATAILDRPELPLALHERLRSLKVTVEPDRLARWLTTLATNRKAALT